MSAEAVGEFLLFQLLKSSKVQIGRSGKFLRENPSPFGGKKKKRSSIKKKRRKKLHSTFIATRSLVAAGRPQGYDIFISEQGSRETGRQPRTTQRDDHLASAQSLRGCSLTSSPQNGCGGNLRSLTPSDLLHPPIFHAEVSLDVNFTLALARVSSWLGRDYCTRNKTEKGARITESASPRASSSSVSLRHICNRAFIELPMRSVADVPTM